MQLAHGARLGAGLGSLQRKFSAAVAQQQQRGIAARRGGLQVCATFEPNMERSMLGENFGARDATEGELASGFGENVLGNSDTDHIIRPPDGMADLIGLRNKRCVPCEGGAVPLLSESEVNRLCKQCPGWRVEKTSEGVDCITHDWKVRNFVAGLDLFQRIAAIAEAEGHHPDLHLTGFNCAVAQLSTHAAKGLTENDFIVAAKINDIEISDLLPKRKAKYWA